MAAFLISCQQAVVAGGIRGRGMELPVLKQLGKPNLEVPLSRFLLYKPRIKLLYDAVAKWSANFPAATFIY